MLLCGPERIDILITDRQPEPVMNRALVDAGVSTNVAD